METNLEIGQIVFFCKTENYWDKPYVMKKHHVYNITRSIILRGEVVALSDKEFKAKLIDNNGFERDGEAYVFDNGCLLSNQNYIDFESLGKWKINQ